MPAAKRRVVSECRRPAFATLRRGKHACHHSCYLSEIGSTAVAMIRVKRGSPRNACILSWEFQLGRSSLVRISSLAGRTRIDLY